MKVNVWRLANNNGNTISEGISLPGNELFLEDIHPAFNTTSDRHIWEVQAWIDRNHSEKGWKFQYQEVEVTVHWPQTGGTHG